MRTRALLRYRIADHANAVVWRMPLPRRVRAVLSRFIYRNPPMPATRVLETLDALDSAGVQSLVMGGWGVAALIGKQQRTHRDLDLIVDQSDIDATLAALRGLGYEDWYRNESPAPVGDVELPGDTVVVRDACLQAVDVHPIALAEANLSVVKGTISGRRVLCISAEHQIRAHSGYTKRSRRERQCNEANLEGARTALAGGKVDSASY
jgi:lincosamide nucleotidyltransferase A/C/D/E